MNKEKTVCSTCAGHGEVDVAYDPEDQKLVPCPDCQKGFYETPDFTEAPSIVSKQVKFINQFKK